MPEAKVPLLIIEDTRLAYGCDVAHHATESLSTHVLECVEAHDTEADFDIIDQSIHATDVAPALE